MGLTPFRQNHKNHPQKSTQSSFSQKSINYIGAKNHPLLTSVPKTFSFIEYIIGYILVAVPQILVESPKVGRSPTPTRRKRCHTEAGCVSSRRNIFAVRFTQSRCDGICEKNTEGTAFFGELLFFFRHSSLKCKDFCVRLEKNICPIGVRLWPVCTRSLWNCTISFICLWGLLVLYFRMLDDIGKPVFSRPRSISLWSPWLFCFQRVFSHSSPMTRWIAVAALAHDWIWRTIHGSEITIRQIKFIIYHISFLMESVIFVHVLLQSLQALHHLRIFGELFFVTSLSMQPQ